MKHLIIISVVALLFSCNTKAKKETSEASNENDIAQESTSSSEEKLEEQEEILVGKYSREDLEKAPFKEWFEAGYNDYETKEDVATAIDPLLDGVEIKVFMGTWCSDSQREVPHFFKIMDEANYGYKNFSLIMMTRDKTTPENFEKDLNITNVPTFIFYKDGKEVNRIVEYSINTLEEDILAILKGEGYKNAYAE
ncbi:TlpA family protein disulfide reductase [Galbibacter mesophilus]|uniref:TlpA family protein disulfide reductase n=1 Tax=Galbibacter mesophilus TaxID=379069 RepID=UPI00191ED9B0|nr:thioredoxin family protein [Galbibacter mesophilus]MCM5663678.1 thioredoxin family protein [Galbibacter mesophilus]